MKKSLFFAFPIILTAFFTGCSKDPHIPTPSNINLGSKPLPEIKAILDGKWQLHFLKGGFCGVCQYGRYNEFYTFSNLSSHIKWTIDKQVWADTSITWLKQEWLNRQINVMEFYADDQYLHHLSPDRIFKDTLVMYEPGPDGMSNYFTRVKL